MKECWSEGELRAYLDRELPPDDMERIAGHLEVCSECGDLWSELAGRASRVSLLMESLAEAEPASAVSIARAPRRVKQTKWLWTGVAAALAAGLVLAFVALSKHQPTVTAVVPTPPVVLATPDPVVLPPARAVSAVAHPGAVHSATPVKRRVPEARQPDDFVSLDDEPISTGVVLRVELGPKGIPADVIFGPDGRPHAIRLVNNQSKY
ncbi:MAG TPA: zf-HC2 domain-containing protein [Bryobacteraceae bacterium]|nr:zf-HC2 domain-containing protein [Bryobacteraceae bacterium]